MILVVGAQGMLGTDLLSVLGEEAVGVDLAEIDITSPESVRRVVAEMAPQVVVNCAAFTDVDGCESRPETAFAVNGHGVDNLAAACSSTGSLLVHVSTDYVFDGTSQRPYLEDDPVSPLSVYGRSKLLGEENARQCPEHLVVRTQWLYGHAGKNFVETMLRVGKETGKVRVVDDQVGSPTWTVDLSRGIASLIRRGCRGTFHVVNSGTCSWNGFARAIFEEAGLAVEVSAMTTEELGRPAPRPLFSALSTAKMEEAAGFTMPPWREALRNYISGR